MHRRSLARIICSQQRGQGTPTGKCCLSFHSLFAGSSWTAHLYPIGIQLGWLALPLWSLLTSPFSNPKTGCYRVCSSLAQTGLSMAHLSPAFLFLASSFTFHSGGGDRMEAMQTPPVLFLRGVLGAAPP